MQLCLKRKAYISVFVYKIGKNDKSCYIVMSMCSIWLFNNISKIQCLHDLQNITIVRNYYITKVP